MPHHFKQSWLASNAAVSVVILVLKRQFSVLLLLISETGSVLGSGSNCSWPTKLGNVWIQPQPRNMVLCFVPNWWKSLCPHPSPPMGIFHQPTKHVLLTSHMVLGGILHECPPALLPTHKSPYWQVRRSGSPGQQLNLAMTSMVIHFNWLPLSKLNK